MTTVDQVLADRIERNVRTISDLKETISRREEEIERLRRLVDTMEKRLHGNVTSNSIWFEKGADKGRTIGFTGGGVTPTIWFHFVKGKVNIFAPDSDGFSITLGQATELKEWLAQGDSSDQAAGPC